MTREEAIEYLKLADTTVGKKIKTRIAEAIEMAIKALEQEPCEDAISRQAVISVIYDRKSDFKNDFIQGFFADKIRDLPSVTLQTKIGRWIESTGHDDTGHFYTCSECGRYINLICGAKLADYPYCHCGAKMVVPQESEEQILPVTPQQKMGKWIDDKCSVCGKGIEDLISSREWYRNEVPKFCPFCGAKIEEEQEWQTKKQLKG